MSLTEVQGKGRMVKEGETRVKEDLHEKYLKISSLSLSPCLFPSFTAYVPLR